jgi:NAD(P)-dependent dehydrogenase (short-subunit alcohol dehydrogenase family)
MTVARRFEDKVALITGGTRGIGFATARALAREGAGLVICGTDPERVEAAAADLEGLAATVAGYTCDVTDEGQLDELIVETDRLFGRLDVCVVAAGVSEPAMVLDMTAAAFDHEVAVNLRGLFLTTQKAAALLSRSGGGSIVHLGSVGGVVTGPEGGDSVYEATKAGVHALTRAAAIELAPLGIRVNAVAPGWIATDMTADIVEPLRSEYIRRVPLGRFAEPAEAAEAILFLASDDAAAVTGTVLTVDGGLLAV